MGTREENYILDDVSDDSASESSSGDDGEEIELIVDAFYDVKDKHGRWFEGKILRKTSNEGA